MFQPLFLHRIKTIFFIQGTGKSVLGMHLAYYLWKLNKQLSNKRKILYCGPSNKSV